MWYTYNNTDLKEQVKYRDKFLQIKQEPSVWPSHCKTDAEKEENIQYYEKMVDILKN